jgi:hypothetical protein
MEGAFETWDNGISALYLASKQGEERVNQFIEDAKSSFATLHTFECEEEAIKEYDKHMAQQ